MPNDDWKKKMMEADAAAAKKAGELIDDDLEILMKEVATLKTTAAPQTADSETYAKIIAVVEQATRKNESIAQLKANLKKLGGTAVALVKDVAGKVRDKLG